MVEFEQVVSQSHYCTGDEIQKSQHQYGDFLLSHLLKMLGVCLQSWPKLLGQHLEMNTLFNPPSPFNVASFWSIFRIACDQPASSDMAILSNIDGGGRG